MKTAAIIAEYNPFHNGHKYHIEMTRKQGATHIMAVMSPNFVQRGDIAVFEKRIRTLAALKNGVDLVLELPTPFAMSNAQGFARGAIEIIKSTGCADILSFGSECANAEKIMSAVKAVSSKECEHLTKKYLEQGNSFVKARSLAISDSFNPETAEIISNPNDTLAVEYIRSLMAEECQIELLPIKRIGVSHDDDKVIGKYASASLIRKSILKQNNIIPQNFLPCNALELYKREFYEKKGVFDINNLFKVIVYKLRSMTPDDIRALPDVSEGIENKIKKAAATAQSFDELLFMIKSKRYTMARIRRIVCCALNEITAKTAGMNAPYIRVLGFNSHGTEILAKMRKTAILPVSASLAELEKENEACRIFARTESRCTDNFLLSGEKTYEAGFDYVQKPIIV